MDKLIEYQRFPDYDTASELIDILEANEIPYQVDDSALRFDIAANSFNPIDKQVIIQIREDDFERANLLYTTESNQTEKNPTEDHYLYSFSDNDIIDVIANPDEWTDFEVKLAKEISKQRGLKPTAEIIKTIRKDKINEQIKVSTESKRKISMGYSWFLWIAILSIVNTIDFTFHKRLFFIFGLGMTQLVDGVVNVLQGKFIAIGLLFNILISSVFILFWYYAKKKKQWAFLTGMILYGLDTILFIIARDWLSMGFHLFVLLLIFSGYDALYIKKEKTGA